MITKISVKTIIILTTITTLLGFSISQGKHLVNRIKDCSTVSFLDIGQGDSVLLNNNRGEQILIDGGSSPKILVELGKVMPSWDKKIELMILSHSHADHVNGLAYTIKNFKIDHLLLNGATDANNQALSSLITIAKAQGTAISFAKSNLRFQIKPFDILIMAPETSYLGKSPPQNLNNTSIIGKITIKDASTTDKTSLFFSGDAELEAEAELIELSQKYNWNLQATIFKAGHHGSRTSSSQALLDLIKPKIVVIQSGEDNSYGHPHLETLEKLARMGIKTYRNDLDGTVNFRICANKISANGTDLKLD